jgi:hypothetical protein
MLESIDDHSEGPLAMFLMAWRKHKNRTLDLDVFVIPVVPYNVQIPKFTKGFLAQPDFGCIVRTNSGLVYLQKCSKQLKHANIKPFF